MSKYYVIEDTLKQVDYDPFWANKLTVAIITMEEFVEKTTRYDMGIDIELSYDSENIRSTKAIVNYNSLTGSFYIPDRSHIFDDGSSFLFAIKENGICIINDDGTAEKIIDKIARTKKWRAPSLERFIYDFLSGIIEGDMKLLDSYENQMDKMEDIIDSDIQDEDLMSRLADIRSALQELRNHYQQLSDLARDFEENENEFFIEDNLRFFRMFIERIDRLETVVGGLRDHSMQVRDLYQSHLAEQQNHIVTLLTIVTTIAVPLTFITSWYGMNFVHMPELDHPYSYPLLIVLCLTLTGALLWYFKKKKWL